METAGGRGMVLGGVVIGGRWGGRWWVVAWRVYVENSMVGGWVLGGRLSWHVWPTSKGRLSSSDVGCWRRVVAWGSGVG